MIPKAAAILIAAASLLVGASYGTNHPTGQHLPKGTQAEIAKAWKSMESFCHDQGAQAVVSLEDVGNGNTDVNGSCIAAQSVNVGR